MSNELFRAIKKFRISGEVRQVLDHIIQETYGWNRKEAQISLNDFCKELEVTKQSVSRSLRKLQEMRMINVNKSVNVNQSVKGFGITYSIQKDYDLWKPLTNRLTLTNRLKNVNQSVKEPLTNRLKASFYKDISLKTIKNTIAQIRKDLSVRDIESFEAFWKAYPRKIAKKECFTKWKSLIKGKSDDEVVVILKGLGKQLHSKEWQRDQKFIPYPLTWLNQGRWEDEIE